VHAPDDRSSRIANRQQIPATGSFMISKPPENWQMSSGGYGSIAVTKPQKLSGRSKTTSGQPEQLLLRPRAKGRI